MTFFMNCHDRYIVGISPSGFDTCSRTRIRSFKNKNIALQKEFLANIIENNNDAIISVNLDNIITSWNPAAEKLLEFKKEEVLGKSVLENLVPDELKKERSELISIVKTNKIKSIKTTRYTKNKKTIPVILTISPIYDTEGKLIGYSSILKDLRNVKNNDTNN